MTIWKLPETQKQLKPNTLDSRLRGNDGIGLRLSIKIPKPSFPQTYIPSFPRKWESRTSNFQIIFKYCRRPKVWIPACAGMTASVCRFQTAFRLNPAAHPQTRARQTGANRLYPRPRRCSGRGRGGRRQARRGCRLLPCRRVWLRLSRSAPMRRQRL